MKNISLLFLSVMFTCKSYGQTPSKTYGKINVEITKEKRPKRIYAEVKILSTFFGGDSSWIRNLEKTLNGSLTELKKIKKGKYIVTAIFIATTDSTLSNIQCIVCPGFGISGKVISALTKKVKWIPGPQGTNIVKPYRTSAVNPPPINN